MPNKAVVCNCDYNLAKQLTKSLQLAWNVDTYVKDAKAARHKDCAELWQKVKKNAESQAKLIDAQLKKKVKSGDFC